MDAREQWLAERRSYLTASDVGPVMGLSPFKTRKAVLDEKLGNVPMFDIGRNPRVAAGRHLEDGILAWVLEDRGWVGHQNGPRLRHSVQLPYLAATPDGYVKTPNGYELVEVKNVKEGSRQFWKQGEKNVTPSTILRAGTDSPGRGWAAPVYYWVQLQVQLHCTNKDSGWIVACIGGVDRIDLHYMRDREFEARMLEHVASFWNEKCALERAFSFADEPPGATTSTSAEDNTPDAERVKEKTT